MTDLILRNYTEEMVRSYVGQYLPTEKDICHCERCELDIIAYMLNHLPASYGISHKGYLFDKIKTMDPQHRVTLAGCFHLAIQTVQTRPGEECVTQNVTE